MNLFGLSTTSRFPFVVRAGQHDMPARADRQRVPNADILDERAVPGNALSDWFLQLPDLLPPKQVSMILRGALAGNLWQQHQLYLKMFESWPTFRKCATELRTAVRMVHFKVDAACNEGEQPTKSAADKAAFVRRCFDSFEPDRFKDEDAFRGMIFDLTDAWLNGVSMTELIWDLDHLSPDGKPEKIVRASAWVHPRNYGVQSDGSIGVADQVRGDPMAFRGMVTARLLTNPSKFLVAKYKSKSGSPLGAGEVRALAMSWANIVFALDWMRNTGQKFGTPFFAIPYTPGIPESERVRFETAAKRAAANGYLVYPRQSAENKVEIYPGQNITGDNPIRVMIDLAEKWCVQLLLGQTLTSDTSDGGKGGSSYALGSVHAGVKQEKLESIADWIAEILQTQLATRLVAENWGEGAGEVPKIEADFTHVETPLEAAQRMAVITTQCRMPVVADEAYHAVGLRMPTEGDEVLNQGQIGVQSAPMSDEEKFAQQMDRQVQQAETSMALQAEAQGQQEGAVNEPEQTQEAVEARQGLTTLPDWNIRATLAQATSEQLQEVESLVIKATEAGTGNGEWSAVKVAVAKIGKGSHKRITF